MSFKEKQRGCTYKDILYFWVSLATKCDEYNLKKGRKKEIGPKDTAMFLLI